MLDVHPTTKASEELRSEQDDRIPQMHAVPDGTRARVVDQPGPRTLRSASSSSLLVSPVMLSTVASRVFTVAGPRVWNTVPEETTSAPSATIFCQHRKTWLFRQSYPDLII